MTSRPDLPEWIDSSDLACVEVTHWLLRVSIRDTAVLFISSLDDGCSFDVVQTWKMAFQISVTILQEEFESPPSMPGLPAPTLMEHPRQVSTGWVARSSCGSVDRAALKTAYSLFWRLSWWREYWTFC